MNAFIKVLPRNLINLIAFSLLFCAAATAQVTTADVTGRVLDQNGAAVANATVTARNTGTGAERTTQSNESGEYAIRELPPGRYDVTAEAPNFSKGLAKDLELNVGSTATLNFDLRPGQITETVEIASDTALVETTRSDIGGVVTPLEVENLPLLNRTFANLSVIMPEARPAGNFDPTKTRVGNVAFNGGDGRQVDVNVDGGDNKDNVVGSLLQNFSYESIQEFQVLQHRWTAEQGRAVGGVVNVITKTGGNEFHGSLFANFRDEKLRALDFFEKQREASDPNFVKPTLQPSGDRRLHRRADQAGQALLLLRAGALPRAAERGRPAGRLHAARLRPRRRGGLRNPDALQRHAAHGEDRPPPDLEPDDVLPLRLPEERLAERSGAPTRPPPT